MSARPACRCSTEGFPGGFSSAGENLLIYFIQFYVVHPLWMMCRPLGPAFFCAAKALSVLKNLRWMNIK